MTDSPVLLTAVFALGAVFGIAVNQFLESRKRTQRQTYWRERKQATNVRNEGFRKERAAIPLKGTPERAKLDAAEQLRCVMEASFSARALLNRPEAAVFKALDAAVIERNPGWQVMAQVSLGEFLASDDQDAYFAVNSKRVDFALMDPACRVRHALEYQGTGHHQGSAAARDAVKKEALRKAGIGYHEIVAGHTTPSELKRLVERLVPADAGGSGKNGWRAGTKDRGSQATAAGRDDEGRS